MPPQGGRKENVIMKKFCTRCGHEFEAIGREVICPDCKAQAAEDAKRAAVLKAKRASWNGESVPVRISGRASTVIREFSKAHDVPFAEALDALLKSTSFFEKLGVEWGTIVPYKSHRRDKATSTAETAQDTASKQDEQEVKAAAGKPQDAPQAGKQAAKVASKQAAGKAASKNKTAAGKKA